MWLQKTRIPGWLKILNENLIYKVTVKTEKYIKTYIGSTELTFKDRFTKHKYSFKHVKHRNTTTLSKFILKLKNNNIDFKINWDFITNTTNKYSLNNGCNLLGVGNFSSRRARLNLKKSFAGHNIFEKIYFKIKRLYIRTNL